MVIQTRHNKLIIALSTAVENRGGSLDKEATSHDSFYIINQFPIYDDIARKQFPEIDKYDNLVDIKSAIPLTFLE
jgi:hypothetical protein